MSKYFDTFLNDFLISGLISGVSKTMVAPIERVKLILQNQHIIANKERNYNGILDCFRGIYRNEGFFSFWKGNLSNCIRYFPNQAFNFAFKDSFRKMITVKNDASRWEHLKANMFAGGLAGSCSLIVVQPIDFVRTNLAVDTKKKGSEAKFNTIGSVIRDTMKKEGLSGFYRGYWVTALGIFPYRGIYFGVYDTLKNESEFKKIGYIGKTLVAQGITIFASSLCYWADTIRRRMMMQASKEVKDYSGYVDCFKKILLNEGIRGFYKGFVANAFRSIGSALMIVNYDVIQTFLEKRKKNGINSL